MNLFPQLPNHRRSPVPIPENTAEATAAVVSWIKSDGQSPERSSAVEAFNQRIARLTDPDPKVLIEELAGHAAVLTALAERWAVAAVSATTVEARARYGKLHLQSQSACMKTLLTIKALQAKGAVVTINDDDEDQDT